MTRRTRRTAWDPPDVPAERPVGIVELLLGGALIGAVVVGLLGLLVGDDDEEDDEQTRRR